MKKIILFLVFMLGVCSIAYSAYDYEWRKGTGENIIKGTELGADIDVLSYQYIVNPLDRILANYRQGCDISYSSASTVSISAGEVVCSSSDGVIRRFRLNSSATSATWTNIDTGSEEASETYYVYAVADADSTAFTITISKSATSPTGVTYFKRLGHFYNNADSDITLIVNDNFWSDRKTYDSGWFAVDVNTDYVKTHNLSTTAVIASVYFSESSLGTDKFYGPMPLSWRDHNPEYTVGACIAEMSASTVTLRTGNRFTIPAGSVGADSYETLTSGYLRIIMMATE